MAMAVAALNRHEVSRVILTRPAVEAGERLGFLPGTMAEKVDPYLRPLYDALSDMMPFEKATRLMERGTIEVAPLAFMRGRTLNDAFVILDEAQNTTSEQMKMFLTRLGFDSKAVVTGDITQIDLPAEKRSGLVEASELLQGIEGSASCASRRATSCVTRWCSPSSAPTNATAPARPNRRSEGTKRTPNSDGPADGARAGVGPAVGRPPPAALAGFPNPARAVSRALRALRRPRRRRRIADLNARYRGVSRPTDVLAFSHFRGRARGPAREAAGRRRDQRRDGGAAGAPRPPRPRRRGGAAADPRNPPPARLRPPDGRRGARRCAPTSGGCGGRSGHDARRRSDRADAARCSRATPPSPSSPSPTRWARGPRSGVRAGVVRLRRCCCSRSRVCRPPGGEARLRGGPRRARAILHWIYVVTVVYGQAPVIAGFAGPLGLGCYIAAFTAIFAAGAAGLARARLDRPWPSAALLWTAVDHLRSFALSGFPVGDPGLRPAPEFRPAGAGALHRGVRPVVRQRARRRRVSPWAGRSSDLAARRRPRRDVWLALAGVVAVHVAGFAARSARRPRTISSTCAWPCSRGTSTRA